MEKFTKFTKVDSCTYKYDDNGEGLKNYQINEAIGEGSFGKVYSAVDLKTGEKVAIKKIVINS